MTEHEKHVKKDETFTIKKTALWQGTTAVLGFLLIFSIFTGGFGYGDTTKELDAGQAAPTAAAPAAGQAAPNLAEVDIGDSPVKGDDDAPVTIIEFSDFQCPFCSRFYTQTLPQLENEYINTGKVKFVYMHFPLDNIHPEATPAALATECARDQGKFWEFHDLVFENQQSIGDASYKQWASQLSLDTTKFNDCYDSKKFETDVRDDLAKGSAAGIRGTPGFLLNGQLISGAQPFAVFQQAIEAELAG
jgi:protein-disulfide isomerase